MRKRIDMYLKRIEFKLYFYGFILTIKINYEELLNTHLLTSGGTA